jgi:hypothetical protein
MKKICFVLCLSLFASLIHGAVMPIELLVNQSQHQMTVIENSAHHCDEVVNNSQDTNNNQQCHSDSYQCCLGLVISPALDINLTTDFTGILASQHTSLVLQPMINFIYKPPKA